MELRNQPKEIIASNPPRHGLVPPLRRLDVSGGEHLHIFSECRYFLARHFREAGRAVDGAVARVYVTIILTRVCVVEEGTT